MVVVVVIGTRCLDVRNVEAEDKTEAVTTRRMSMEHFHFHFSKVLRQFQVMCGVVAVALQS
jgi:hypothetical protein